MLEDGLIIREINCPIVELRKKVGDESEYVCHLNEYELLDVRVQIKEKELRGYFIEFYDKEDKIHHIRIDHQGNLEYYPDGLLDMGKYHAKLV